MAVDPLLRRQIIAAAEDALQSAGAVDVLPTPLDAVVEAIGVREVISIADLPEDLVVARPSGWRRLLGAYLYRADTAFVDLSQPVGRRRFILAHEAGHKIIPWHSDSFHLDDDARIFQETEEELEEEANLAGTLLIFQGGRFVTRALDYQTGLQVPVALAATYGASLTATIRYYAEHHPDAVGLVVAGRYPRADGTVPIWVATQSEHFTDQFGEFRSFFPGPGVSVASEGEDAFGPIALAALSTSGVSSAELRLRDRNGDWVRCDVQAFFNQRCLFVFATPVRRVRRGRRLKVEVG